MPAADGTLSDLDAGRLREAIMIAADAVDHGHRPFGAIVVDGRGFVVGRAGAIAPTEVRDSTAHSPHRAFWPTASPDV